MAASNLVTHLAEPSQLPDASWVRPGRVAWSWWSETDSPRDLVRQRDYVDLAADLGWEHCLVDANWDVNPDDDVAALARYARERGVGLWLWYNSGGPHNDVTERPARPHARALGAAGGVRQARLLGRRRRQGGLLPQRQAGRHRPVPRDPRRRRGAPDHGELPRLHDPAGLVAHLAAPDDDGGRARRGDLPLRPGIPRGRRRGTTPSCRSPATPSARWTTRP